MPSTAVPTPGYPDAQGKPEGPLSSATRHEMFHTTALQSLRAVKIILAERFTTGATRTQSLS